MATLYIVATPIGNLEDMTFRAIRVLKEAAVIFCEDTRTSKVLFSRYDIRTPLESFHAQSPLSKMDHIVELLSGAGNMPIWEAHDRYFELVEAFLTLAPPDTHAPSA